MYSLVSGRTKADAPQNLGFPSVWGMLQKQKLSEDSFLKVLVGIGLMMGPTVVFRDDARIDVLHDGLALVQVER